MREYGMRRAQDLQETSEGMTGTELYEKEDYIPDFSAAVAKKNMLERKAGKTDGFLCRSSAGRIVRLIQNYNSDTYPQEPEELPAQWGFYWSDDPKKALPSSPCLRACTTPGIVAPTTAMCGDPGRTTTYGSRGRST